MSFLFGGVREREDPELAAAHRSARLHLARDINDERALAEAAEPVQARRNHGWAWLVAAIAVLAVLAVVGPRGHDAVAITTSCTTPGIAVAASRVTAGDPLQYEVTGPDHADYVVTLDGAAVRGAGGSLISYTETDAGPAFELRQCLSPTLTIAAPAGNGPHRLALLTTGSDGTLREAAATMVTVTGTR